MTSFGGQNRKPFCIGHSLINFNMPAMVHGITIHAGKTTCNGSQEANGSPLHISLNNHATTEATSYPNAFPIENYNPLIITEALPLLAHITWNNSNQFANNFYQFTINNKNRLVKQFYVFETCHYKNANISQAAPNGRYGCKWDKTVNSSTLSNPKLLPNFPLWSSIITHVHAQNPIYEQIWMVSVAQALYQLTTQINLSNVPRISSFTNLLLDDIHLTNAENYFVPYILYDAICSESPVGLTQKLNNMWGGAFTKVRANAQPLIMQQVTLQTIISLPA